MSETPEPLWNPPAVVCCCRNGAKPLTNGDTYINAGCKIHGLGVAFLPATRNNKDVIAPSGHVRVGSAGMFHRAAE